LFSMPARHSSSNRRAQNMRVICVMCLEAPIPPSHAGPRPIVREAPQSLSLKPPSPFRHQLPAKKIQSWETIHWWRQKLISILLTGPNKKNESQLL
jgi:hypothetical protein